MTPAPPRRLQPLAGWSVVAAFALIGAALLATVWTTRATVLDAYDEVRRGQVSEVAEAVRADLNEVLRATPDGRPPSSEDLAAILADHADEGLRYIGVFEHRRAIAEAGTAVGNDAPEQDGKRADRADPKHPMRGQEVGGRIRIDLRVGRRLRAPRVVLELDPQMAAELRGTATVTLWIGGLAALALLGVAVVVIRREARRRADERIREREQRLASLGEMSAVLAHEMRNPLASLKGNAQLLAAMLPTGEKPRAKADRVVDEAIRLEQLTNDLLAFVRTGAIQRAPTDPAALARDAAASVSDAIDIHCLMENEQWMLDGGRVREVLVNLLDNAVAAGPPVTLGVRTEQGRLVFEVGDRGPGVPPDEREKIFEPFHTTKTAGTGLGLAVARRVVDLHGGRISVSENPGGGALFRVEIPRE